MQALPRYPTALKRILAIVVLSVGYLILSGCSKSNTDNNTSSDRYDVIIYGATPGGIACAVRLAREGQSILLVSYNDRIGGMLTSGLGVWDTLYENYRSPIYNELRQTFFDYYRETFGDDSQVYIDSRPRKSGHNNGTFEAHIAERFVNELVSAEPNIEVLYHHYPFTVEKTGSSLKSITFRRMDSDDTQSVQADYFVDGSYEGDLMALAGVKYRIGRESQDEFNEKHAGVVFMLPVKEREDRTPREARILDNLNFRHFGGEQKILYPDSTHEADTNVQAYNMRYYITNDPDNQIEVTPSDNYDPEFLQSLEFQSPGNVVKPNNKLGVNRPQLVGLHNEYVEGDWETRRKVIAAHIEATRDLVYFMKHDPAAPEQRQKQWQDWGLAADEFVDNDNNPYEIYVREARRLVGPHVYTQNDLSLHPEYDRTPVHHDSIGIVEWYMDSHACTWQKSPQGGLHEGKMMIHKETFIGQFPYRSIITKEVDNLIVPVCSSTTHVAWGAYRLEPTWMQIGESAAYAILQAKENKQKLADIDTQQLVRTLAKQRSLITFFNDFFVDGVAEWIPAVQYFGTQGFFDEYDAHPHNIISEPALEAWVSSTAAIQSGNHNADALTIELSKMDDGNPATVLTLSELFQTYGLPVPASLKNQAADLKLTRSMACQYLFEILDHD